MILFFSYLCHPEKRIKDPRIWTGSCKEGNCSKEEVLVVCFFFFTTLSSRVKWMEEKTAHLLQWSRMSCRLSCLQSSEIWAKRAVPRQKLEQTKVCLGILSGKGMPSAWWLKPFLHRLMTSEEYFAFFWVILIGFNCWKWGTLTCACQDTRGVPVSSSCSLVGTQQCKNCCCCNLLFETHCSAYLVDHVRRCQS